MIRKIEILLLFVSFLILCGACTPNIPTESPVIETEANELEVQPKTEPVVDLMPTDTPEPTPTAALSPTPRTVFWEDDFSNVNSGWERYREFDGVLDYDVDEEAYQMLVMAEDNLWWVWRDETLTDVSMSIDVWQVGGPEGSLYGLMCRFNPEALNGFVFVINSEGQAGVGTINSGFEPIPGGELATFEAIQTGINVKNTIEVSCTGERLTMAVNGETLIELPATGITGEDIGLAVATNMGADADIYFDNLVIYQP